VPTSDIMAYDSLLERYGRILAYDLACTAGDTRCHLDTDFMLSYFESPDYGIVIPRGYENMICLGLRENHEERYFYGIWRIMQDETDSVLRGELIAALGCTGSEAFLMEFLESSIDADFNYTLGERQAILRSSFKSRVSFPLVVEFVKSFESQLAAAYEQDLVTVLTIVASAVKRQEELNEMQNYVVLRDSILTSAEMLALLQVMAGNMERQNTWPYSRQMELVQQLNIDFEFDLNDYRQIILPGSSHPTSYTVHIDVNYFNLAQQNITGTVQMEITMTQHTDKIYFHSANQTIKEMRAWDRVDGSEVGIIDFRFYPQYETVMVLFNRTFLPGNEIFVDLAYEGWMRSDGKGLYLTRYQLNGANRNMVAAKFEPYGTRYAFPCYDGELAF
jgi:hypothetical protein